MKVLKIKNRYYESKQDNSLELFDSGVGSVILSTLVIVLISGLIMSEKIIASTEAEGASMQPTFDTKVQLYYNQSDIAIDNLTYNDIISFETKTFGTYIKRIIGLPGDTVEIIDRKLYINGEFVQEDFIIPDDSQATLRKELGEDEYYVMGDNRANSTDSRHVLIGAIKKSDINGRVIGGKSRVSDETYNFLRIY